MFLSDRLKAFICVVIGLARIAAVIAAAILFWSAARVQAQETDDLFTRLTRTAKADQEASATEQLSGQLLQIAAFDDSGSAMLLSRDPRLGLQLVRSRSPATQWWIAPLENGYVRVQAYENGAVHALAASSRGRLSLSPLSQSSRQLWRVLPGRTAGRFVLSSAAFPGYGLTYNQAGALVLQPIAFTATQLWAPLVVPGPPSFPPFYRSLSTEIIPNPPLPPAKIELVNTHKYALIVLLGDSRAGSVDQIRIEPRTSQVVVLERDAGASVVEVVEVRLPGGLWDRREFVTAIPAQAFYDLSVYEEHLQSIAIDATGKSPNPIEDVNYVPKSVGWIALPAGPEMPEVGQIDVYGRALAAKNPGAVRRMDPEQFEERSAESPLERILEKFESTPRRKF